MCYNHGFDLYCNNSTVSVNMEPKFAHRWSRGVTI